MNALPAVRRRHVAAALLAWLAMLGVDFLVHGGILAGLYQQASPFLLPPAEAFRRIPLGYASFLLAAVLIVWLLAATETRGAWPGLAVGLVAGGLVWGSLALGLASITTARWELLAGWWVGQTVELGAAGAVAGRALHGASLGRLILEVVGLVLLLFVVTVVLQTVGLAPQTRIDH